MSDKTTAQIHARIISRSWSDAAYRKRLLTDTHAALADEGLHVPAGTKVTVHENTASAHHLVIPAKPDAGASSAGGKPSGLMCVMCAEPGNAVMCVMCAEAGNAVMCVICGHDKK